MRTIVGFCAIAALGLTGCNGNSNDFVAGPVDPTPTEDPFGNPIGSPISGLAAFISTDPPVGVPVAAQGAITVTFNADGSFTVITPADDTLTFSGDPTINNTLIPGEDILRFTNADGDIIEVVEGFDVAGTNLLYDIARVDRLGAGDGFEAYGVIGNETERANLPVGTGTYDGSFLASIVNAGALVTDEFTGLTTVTADFGTTFVDVAMVGGYDADGDGVNDFAGNLNSTGGPTLLRADARYSGAIDGSVQIEGTGLPLNVPVTGVLAGSFYGPAAAATAGAFAAVDADTLTVVGGFAADQTSLVPPTP